MDAVGLALDPWNPSIDIGFMLEEIQVSPSLLDRIVSRSRKIT
jgi:hypothetical protein